jgi:O-methyltransferase
MRRSVRDVAARWTRAAVARLGYEVHRVPGSATPGPDDEFPLDFDEEAKRLFRDVRPYTLTSKERVLALRDAVRYVSRAGLQGDIAECGVWRGGSVMVIARTLVELGDTDRHLYLFDTFTRPGEPDARDRDIYGRDARQQLEVDLQNPFYSYLPLDEVRGLIYATGYPQGRIHFVQGLVEETIPDHAPERLALLRLDTDYYRSTAHEMAHLYPRLVPRGVLIVDDYGEFVGARDAVDEYFEATREVVLLNRIDATGRLVVVPDRRG